MTRGGLRAGRCQTTTTSLAAVTFKIPQQPPLVILCVVQSAFFINLISNSYERIKIQSVG